ncbi:MAG: AMP-binding protein, partial [Planctomycetales bacterium]|nr:AMP-binding protein [Planctomycetales bacterium]
EMSHCEVGLMTSGTTGIPKKVFHTMQSLVRSVQEASKHQSDVWGLTYTPTRLAGLQVFFQALANQNTIVRLFGLTPSAMHDAIEEYQVTHLSATPTFFRLLACDGTVHRKVERITFGGEVVDERTISAVCGTFPNAGFKNIYASTEAGSLIMSDSELFNVHPDESHLFQVFGGELAVHRSLLATSLQSSVDGDYYLTGDCVEIVQANPLIFRIVGRRDDFINVGGNKVSPYRIEALLREMPEIRLAKVYGIPNSVTGSLVVCDLVLNDGMQLTAQEVIAELKTRLPLFAVPRIVNFRTEIDVTITGKQSRHQ